MEVEIVTYRYLQFLIFIQLNKTTNELNFLA